MEITKTMVLDKLKELQESGKVPKKNWSVYHQSNIETSFYLDIIKPTGGEQEDVYVEHVFLREEKETILCLLALKDEYKQLVQHAKEVLHDGNIINFYISILITNRLSKEQDTILIPLDVTQDIHHVEDVMIEEVPIRLFYVPCNDMFLRLLEEAKCFLLADNLKE